MEFEAKKSFPSFFFQGLSVKGLPAGDDPQETRESLETTQVAC